MRVSGRLLVMVLFVVAPLSGFAETVASQHISPRLTKLYELVKGDTLRVKGTSFSLRFERLAGVAKKKVGTITSSPSVQLSVLRRGKVVRAVSLSNTRYSVLKIGQYSLRLRGWSGPEIPKTNRKSEATVSIGPRKSSCTMDPNKMICIQLWRPVCAVREDNSIVAYPNSCYAALDCAQVVSDDLCNLVFPF